MNNVIIVAGGKGVRMGGDLPKQFIAIDSKPILMRTIENFYDYDKSIRIIVVLHQSFREHWSRLCKGYSFNLYHEVADGGENRFESVKNGLELVSENGLVAVHDAVRPFTTKSLIAKCFEEASVHKAVVPVVRLTDSVRELASEDGSRIVDRDLYRLVQTPQVFDVNLLKRAYLQPFNSLFTDDASVVESFGHPVFLVEGETTNIKITTPFDLKVAEAILKS